MRIVFYSPAWPAAANGIATYVSHMAPALRKLGHEVRVLTFHAKGSQDDPDVIDLQKYRTPKSIIDKVISRASKTDYLHREISRPIARALLELNDKKGLDLIEIEESFGISSVISALDIAPVCVRLHGPWFLTKRYEDRRRERLEKRAIELAQIVTCPSSEILETVRKSHKLPLITNSYPNPIPMPSRQWSPQPQSEDILLVGRFDLIKGADIALKAFAKLGAKRPGARLTFVGPDLGIDGVEIREYAQSLLSNSALSRFSYLGELAQGQINDLRLIHAVTICTSRQETLPYAVMEAMAHGCPVIASNVGGIPELIETDVSGLLFESGNVDALAAQMERVLDDKRFAGALGATARDQMMHLYGPDRIAVLAVETYRQAILKFPHRNGVYRPDQHEYY